MPSRRPESNPPPDGRERLVFAPGVYSPQRLVRQRIADYVPRHAPRRWNLVADDVRALVWKAGPGTPQEATELLLVVARLALHCHLNRRLDPGSWPEPDTVAWFLDTGCGDLKPQTRSVYRARLRRLSEAIFGVDGAKPVPLSASDCSRPYRAEEQRALWSWARSQSTEALRFDCRLLLALGLGCGLTAEEIVGLRTAGIRTAESNGAVVVAVVGRRERLVVCRHTEEDELAELAEGAAAGYLFSHNAVRTKNLTATVLARAHRREDTPPIRVSRLRNTWLSARLAERVPVTTLLSAAGLDSLASLDRLLPHLPPVGEAQSERYLRGQ
ncbi:hypothetical protein [Actinosynnema sp. NPDC020468]|uniref:hypothetical protein n=1 Tax=Actinosynnema sp. NPDC020468 TaxID=3154488 RepID=UPI003401913E